MSHDTHEERMKDANGMVPPHPVYVVNLFVPMFL